MDESVFLGRNISVAYRMANRFYDRALAPWGIGCGQQFFLLRVYEHQGISMYDLARMGLYDKGTVTRAVQKLEELGYVKRVPDDHDRRTVWIHLTDSGAALLHSTGEEMLGKLEHVLARLDAQDGVSVQQLIQAFHSLALAVEEEFSTRTP